MGKYLETSLEGAGNTPPAVLLSLTSPSNQIAEKSQLMYNKKHAQTDRSNVISMQKVKMKRIKNSKH